MIHQRKILKAIAYAILLCFTSLTGAQPLYAIPPNTQLPVVDTNFTPIGANVPNEVTGNTMNIQQIDKTSIIKWEDFSIGADAAVNFNYNGEGGFNSLNYVTGTNAPISEIYGQLTALGGNIFIANPAGVQIGNSAQINVGSLYVTNKDIGNAVDSIKGLKDAQEIRKTIAGLNTGTNAQLMSLGAITNATNVTFDGARIVLDTDRIYTANGDTGELEQVGQEWFGNLHIRTTDRDNVVLGSSERANIFTNFSINGDSDTLEKGYMWVHDLDELQAMGNVENLNGWYALRNSIDAYNTASMDDGKGFAPIGDSSQAFTGRFDGLGYSIFGLNVKEDTDAAGLFGVTSGAHIKNFTLNGGTITGGEYIGAAVGSASGGVIENITNTASVSGTGAEYREDGSISDGGVGGIVGYAGGTTMSGLINIGTITGAEDSVNSVNVGGIVGNMSDSTLTGETYNLGSVTGGWNIGGIAGQMTNGAKIGNDGDDAFQIYNQLNIDGEYNVGGIAGTLSDSTITNAANHGNVTAEGYTNDIYKYHTAAAQDNLDGAELNDNLASIAVKAANAGGIAGKTEKSAEISNVVNEGDVTTKTEGNDSHYIAGNVGGIVGRAENTKITNAENKENTVAGAHNVGGVAGFLGGDSTDDIGVNNSVNNGGDITATGARKFNADANDTNGYVKERVRPYAAEEDEAFNVGNIGGIVGYLYGDKAKVKNSGNRGTVHSANIDNVDNVPETAKAANVGGVVGKIDNSTSANLKNVEIQDENGIYSNATVANSYSTGNVRGYTGVGGVVGMMYNGSVAGSYNLGTVQSTRAVSGGREPLNMGGVVGDTTEKSNASAVLYDVYNAGKIGDDKYNFYGRHVGGVVGRLSGELEKAYNTGDIYNGYGTVGGIVGWWAAGGIKNVFNTGNITVVNNDDENGVSQVGGIAGAHSGADSTLSYAYNLGTIRSFTPYGFKTTGDRGRLSNAVGGIIGYARNYQGTGLKIANVYTTNNIYAAIDNNNDEKTEYTSTADGVGAIYGREDYDGNNGTSSTPEVNNAYYVKMYEDSFADLSRTAGVTGTVTKDADGNFAENAFNGFTFNNQTDRNSVNDDEDGWRIYNGTTPILNAFLPNSEGYFSGKDLGGLNIDSVQYGTAANPLLTIINAKDNSTVELNWGDLNSSGNASFAVYGGGLTLSGFDTGTGYYRGTLYADGVLSVTGTDGSSFNLGSSANLYGTDVTLTANGDATIYGNVTSTNGNISIKGGDIEILGKLSSSKVGEATQPVKNISKTAGDISYSADALKDPTKSVPTVSNAYAHTPVIEGNKKDGDITVTASGTAEVLYGNLGTGSVSTAGEFNVTGGAQENNTLSGGSVYVDSDLSGTTGNINLSAGGEVLLDITNIAKANENDKDPNGAGALHKFLEKYKAEGGNSSLTLKSDGDDEIIAIDMWGDGKFDLNQYNDGDKTFGGAIQALGEDLAGKTHIWISDAEQLKGIQSYAENSGDSDILKYNFALKDNIDASALEDYKAIGGGDEAYSGTFDGRDFRIIGLNSNVTDTSKISSGIFGTLTGTVKDLRVYASKFFGDGESAGAIASEVITQTKEDGSTVSGTITGVTTFGNTVTAEDGAAGGIAGENSGSILESTASDSVTASGTDAYAGGVAGVNTGSIGEKGEEGESAQITADSAVRSGTDDAASIGGVVGKNDTGGKVWLANSLGVTTGANAESTGGIAGTNRGEMTSLYNESIVTGGSSVGGVAGDNSGTMTNAVNATRVTGTGTNTGGLVGNNSGTVDSGRNAGVITGKTSVGGMVGKNEKADGTGGILKNLSNAVTAAIFGSANVGGIAGTNSGTITSDNNLVNEGTVYGNQYVGGIAGVNEQGGVIQNVTSETLVLKTSGGDDAKYFGGIAGQNKGIITDATNESNVEAKGATYVGGIAGHNEGDLKGELTNNGDIIGLQYVGGLAGKNDNDSVLIGTPDNRLQVTNNGRISAENGSAGGIFYENNGEIKYADIVNTGVVDGRGQQNTGGLFGTNSRAITNSTLTNSGEVIGSGNTGGLIGKNTGDVSFSSLINEYGATVTGGENTGGLFGYNTGKITGGRNDAGTKYEHKIYNNGTVTGDSNVGGLIGNNAVGSVLTAGYNTGAVNVTEGGSGENVGGIAGTNAGIIDQVFNTVMTGIDELGETLFGAVTGTNNVGGIVGNNTGKLTNAYNTTTVKSDETKGNIAGANSGTVANVYATNETGMLIGTGNATDSYSFSDADNDKGGISVIAQADRNKQDSYGKFNFTDTDGDKAVWKIYEGKNGQDADGTPLLKVFLTKAEYTGGTGFTYNGQGQGLSLDGVTVDGEKLSDVAKTLLSALEGKNAYNGYLGFTSEQIAASGEGNSFNPNNLGYDIDATFNIKKARLSVTLDDISRTYGDANITNNNTATDNGHYLDGNGYGYTVSAANELTEEMIAELGGEGFYTFVEDGAVKGVSGQKETNDVKGYTWSATFNLGDLSNNYEFADGESTLSLNKGVSNVTKADLHVTLDEAKHTYGNTAVTNNGGAYAIKGDKVTFLNGDEWTVGDLVVTKTEDTALTGDEIRVTENAGGDYKWNGTVVGKDGTNIDQNYNIIIDNAEQGATSTVEQAEITIALDEVQRTYGDTSITNNNGKYTFQFADGTRLVNGDEGLAINPEKIVDNALYYDKNAEETRTQNVKKDDYTWTVDKSDFTGVDDFLTNYDVTVKDGTSIVNQKELTVNDVAASIVYGNQGDRGFKLFDEDGIVSGGLNGIAYGDDVHLNVDFSDISEENLTGEYANNRDGRITANVGTYEDSLIFSGLALTGDSKKIGNYKLASDWAGGKIRVDKANLKITLEDIVREYGTLKPEEGSYGYAAEGLANEDKLTFNDDIAQSLDGALVWKGNELRTNDKGDYSYSDGIEKAFEGFNFGNYGYTIEGGSSEVTPRKISISDIYASIVYGMQDGKGFVIDRGGSLGERAYADDDLNLSYELSLGDGNFDASGVYMTNKDGRKTADVGFYGSEKLTFDGLTLSGEQAGNYELVSNTVNGYITVTPATLYVTLSDVKHTYGDTSLDDDTKYGIDGFSGLVNDDDKNPGYTKDKIFGELSDIDDDALTDDGITKDANPNGESYTWTAKVSTVVDKLSQNYKIEVIDGKSTVGKAKLVVNVNNVDTIYGTQFDKDKYGYVFDENFGLVNNDNEETIRGALGITADDYHNEAEKDGAGGVWTDGYKDDGYEITLNKQVNLTNYEVEYRAGEATVTKADLTIKADDQNMLIGTTPNFTGTTLTELANQLVNGDSLPDGFGYEFGLEDESILDVIGTHPGVIGLLLGGRFYDGGKYEDWGNTVNAVFANYNVNVEPGLLTIVPPSNSNYGHLHSDGWDRLRNFRERKAEVFFHEGGMEYDEDM